MRFNSYTEMNKALNQAKIAAFKGEVPIGVVITDKEGNIISSQHNQSEELYDATAHAEMIAIREASKILKDKKNRLKGCTLFVTLEPCAMCAAAISHARISRLIYAASDIKGGGVENGPRIFEHSTIMHKPEIISGIMEEESKQLLQIFFKDLR